MTAKEAVETSNGENGVPWIGGRSGGVGQPALRFTGDIVQAGYNITLNRPVAATSAVSTSSARLAAIWNRPSEARDWTIEVVGENIVTTCDTCRKDSIPGTGLLPKLHQESAAVTADLQNLVSGQTPPTLANLEDVTAPGIAITRQEAWTKREELPVHIPDFMEEVVERVAFLAREDKRIDQRSGVSQRLPITLTENVVSSAERRAFLLGEAEAVPRIGDLYAAHLTDFLGLVAGEVDEGRVVARDRHEAPRLLVVAGRRPARGLEHAGQRILRIGLYLYVLWVEGVNGTKVLQFES